MAKEAAGTATEHADRNAVDDVLALVRRHGGRATPARRLLLNALFDSHGHRSAEELATQVHAQAPDVNLSTIYRNLEELERLGVIDSTRLGGGPATYHLASTAHGHLVCEQCGAVTEVPDEIFADLAKAAATTYGFAIKPHRFAVTGRCASCQAKDSSAKLAGHAGDGAERPLPVEQRLEGVRVRVHHQADDDHVVAGRDELAGAADQPLAIRPRPAAPDGGGLGNGWVGRRTPPPFGLLGG
jgi:Fur family transcriptional regulator, ferric uptake regulator